MRSSNGISHGDGLEIQIGSSRITQLAPWASIVVIAGVLLYLLLGHQNINFSTAGVVLSCEQHRGRILTTIESHVRNEIRVGQAGTLTTVDSANRAQRTEFHVLSISRARGPVTSSNSIYELLVEFDAMCAMQASGVVGVEMTIERVPIGASRAVPP